jgi:hypothetical protein
MINGDFLMFLFKNKKIQFFVIISSIIGLILVIVIFSYFLKEETKETQLSSNEPKGFAFLNIDETTELSSDVREQLRDTLGPDAIETWTTLDLNLNYKGFLEKYFPELYVLNQRLNSPIGERIEHNTIQLTYRYTRKKNTPFDYVKLVFSNLTKKPLFIYIKSKRAESEILDAITKKYGKAKTFNWDDKNGRSLYWEKNRSILVLSISSDRYGHPEYKIVIYYVPGLEDLVSTEQQKIKYRQEVIKKTGKSAF